MTELDSILINAIAHVPRYRGLKPVLDDFPVLRKHSVFADTAAYLSDELGAEKPGLVSFLCDENRRCAKGEEDAFGLHIVVEETSGSSGIPFRIAKTREERACMAHGIWKYRKKYDPQCSPKNVYMFIHRPANAVLKGESRIFTADNIDRLYEELSAEGFRWVHGSVRVLRKHAEIISKAVVDKMTVRFAENSGEPLSVEDRQFIESHLNVSIIDQYGCRETWAIGTRGTSGYFDVLSDNVVVEILDAQEMPIKEIGKPGRITVTSLHQRIFPIIRYDTGDIGAWGEEPCGSRLNLAGHREHNLLRCNGREMDGNSVFKKLLDAVYKSVGYTPLRYIQIRQMGLETYGVAGSPSDNARKVCEALSQMCKTHEYFTPHVIFEPVEVSADELERELENKPSLFTTKYMPANSRSESIRS